MNVKLYVGNLSFSIGDQELREAFSPHGNLLSASVVTDRESGQSRGFGFVEYGSSNEAEAAIRATLASVHPPELQPWAGTA